MGLYIIYIGWSLLNSFTSVKFFWSIIGGGGRIDVSPTPCTFSKVLALRRFRGKGERKAALCKWSSFIQLRIQDKIILQTCFRHFSLSLHLFLFPVKQPFYQTKLSFSSRTCFCTCHLQNDSLTWKQLMKACPGITKPDSSREKKIDT